MAARESIFDKKPESLNSLKKQSGKFFIAWFDFIAISLRGEILKKPFEFLIIFLGSLLGTILIVFLLLNIFVNRISVNFSAPNFIVPSIPSVEVFKTGASKSQMDPVDLLTLIKSNQNKYVLVDIRSSQEFNDGHIKTAVSVPIYGTELIDKNGKLDISEMKNQINKHTKNKDLIIIYGRTQYSNLPPLVASKIGGKAQALAVGWNEWVHFKNLWVPENMWDKIDIQDYIQAKE